jgi:hypothetical protein
MAFVNRFQNDVFISYTHRDNLSVAGPEDGWVSRLHAYLANRLTQLLGQEALVWRDKKLGGMDTFDTAIAGQLKSSAILLIVVSPGYDRSEWCRKERDAFSSEGRLAVGHRQRISKVVKTPLSDDGHRKVVAEALGYDFFVQPKDSSRFREYEPGSLEFRDTIDNLAQDCAAVLREMRGQQFTSDSGKGAVYLALTTQDQNDDRERLANELRARGYAVRPDRSALPEDVDVVRTWLHDIILGARLAVHLLGHRSSRIPEGGQQSLGEMEYAVARELGLPQVVRIPRATWRRGENGGAPDTSVDLRQRAFLDQVLDEPAGRNLELLEDKPLEELREVVLDRLRPPPATLPRSEDRWCVYIVCDRDDHPYEGEAERQSLKLVHFLSKQGIEVKVPLTGRSRGVRQDNEDKLRLADGVLLFWGAASEGWFEERLRELTRRARALRPAPFVSQAAYLTQPPTKWKERYETHELPLIRHFDEFDPSVLEPFLEPLRRSRGAPP